MSTAANEGVEWTAADWRLAMILIDVQRVRIGILTAVRRIRGLA